MQTNIIDLTQADIFKIIMASSLGGGVLGAAITSLVNFLLTRRNFKFKSYEEIVKKRFTAYEKMSKVSMRLNLLVREPDDTLTREVFAFGIENFEKFQLVILDAFTDSFWLDKKTGDLISELGSKINNWQAEAEATIEPDSALKNISIRDVPIIKDLSKRISEQLRKELLSLHKVENFINRRTKDTTKFPIMSYKPDQE
jgi:hypothetical protein